MATAEATRNRVTARNQALDAWASEHDIALHHLDEGQQWIVFAALCARKALERLPALTRLLAFVLAHCGMSLSAPVIASLTGVSDRAIRTTKALTATELLHSVRTPPRGRGKPKLGPEHAGVLAKFLVEHRKARVQDILRFIRDDLGVEMDRKTLRVYMGRYGLGCLRGDAVEDTPLLSETQTLVAHSS